MRMSEERPTVTTQLVFPNLLKPILLKVCVPSQQLISGLFECQLFSPCLYCSLLVCIILSLSTVAEDTAASGENDPSSHIQGRAIESRCLA